MSKQHLWICMTTLLLLAACGSTPQQQGEVQELRLPTGAGGVGFLPLRVMQQQKLIEEHARQAGLQNLTVRWVEVGGPAVLNDALLAGSIDFIAAGPPAFITLWDRTVDSAKVMGVAAVAALPMYLNTKSDHLRSIDDLRDTDKVGVTAIKVSIPSLVMQMYARDKYGASQATRFDKNTVAMTHPDGVVALLSGSNAINAHFTSPPFHQRERKDPQVRTIMTSDQVMGGATTFVMLSTTSRFREQNPKVYAAVLAALREAQSKIAADPKAAAGILLNAEGEGGFTVDEVAAVLSDPDVHFTATPQNTMKYASFMNDIGSISHRPASWKEMFFPDIHDVPGN